jgi:hypothetical protein
MLANAVGPMIPAHWAIENSLHWVMDKVFRDDECRVRTDNAPANFATCRHIAYNLTPKAPGKDSIGGEKPQGGTTSISPASSPHIETTGVTDDQAGAPRSGRAVHLATQKCA